MVIWQPRSQCRNRGRGDGNGSTSNTDNITLGSLSDFQISTQVNPVKPGVSVTLLTRERGGGLNCPPPPRPKIFDLSLISLACIFIA